jgi:hypothetical protein
MNMRSGACGARFDETDKRRGNRQCAPHSSPLATDIRDTSPSHTHAPSPHARPVPTRTPRPYTHAHAPPHAHALKGGPTHISTPLQPHNTPHSTLVVVVVHYNPITPPITPWLLLLWWVLLWLLLLYYVSRSPTRVGRRLPALPCQPNGQPWSAGLLLESSCRTREGDTSCSPPS